MHSITRNVLKNTTQTTLTSRAFFSGGRQGRQGRQGQEQRNWNQQAQFAEPVVAGANRTAIVVLGVGSALALATAYFYPREKETQNTREQNPESDRKSESDPKKWAEHQRDHTTRESTSSIIVFLTNTISPL
eukprot:TRINITY_DN1595_c0_g1_i2.p1 TRINITY_DN1595_c0_g1~~TRINITY_DN1595_c0_g1_i2.p1  ORF type:complete len:132 (-),score=29.94 TRINITY_DN1595_c0_g1_i2:39-434(-)